MKQSTDPRSASQMACAILPALTILLAVQLAGYTSGPDNPAPRASPLLTLKDGDRIVYYGGTLLERDRHYGAIETMLRTRFAGRRLSFRNLAWPGDTVNTQLRPLNFGSMERHLRDQKPSVVFVSFGTNEAYEGQAGIKAYISGYRRQLAMLQKLPARIILLSPIRHEYLGPPLPDPKIYNEQAALYHAATHKLAAELGLTYLDLYNSLGPRTGEGVPLTDNGVHLSRYGYWQFSEAVARCLGLSGQWEVVLDFAKQQLLSVQGTRLSKLRWQADGLSFIALDLVLPNPAPEGAPNDADQHLAQRRLIIRGLPAGDYELLANGETVLRAPAQRWGHGLVLTSDPAYQQVRKLREMVIEKDILFFHRWRSHNGEYIYGRRSKPGGGNAGNPSFPDEFAQLDKLLTEADERLNEQATPRAIVYVLRRVAP